MVTTTREINKKYIITNVRAFKRFHYFVGVNNKKTYVSSEFWEIIGATSDATEMEEVP